MEANFVTTRWSVVLQAGDAESPLQREALERLLSDNWYPLYIFVRRSGKSEPEAEDLIQGFFTKLLEKNLLAKIDGQHRGRFRNYLLVCLKNFINDQWKKSSAAKRGGGQPVVSIDVDEAKRRYAVEPSHDLTPEKAFQKAWAVDMVHRALERVQKSWQESGKPDQFRILKVFLLPDEQVPSHAEVAEQLGMTRDALKIKIHRLRAEFRRAFCAEVAETLGRHDLLEDEINFLFSALCS